MQYVIIFASGFLNSYSESSGNDATLYAPHAHRFNDRSYAISILRSFPCDSGFVMEIDPQLESMLNGNADLIDIHASMWNAQCDKWRAAYE